MGSWCYRSSQRLVGVDGLDPCLVVILMDLPVNGRGEDLMLMRSDVLLGHGLPDILVDNGVVLAILGKEVGSCVLGLLHNGQF